MHILSSICIEVTHMYVFQFAILDSGDQWLKEVKDYDMHNLEIKDSCHIDLDDAVVAMNSGVIVNWTHMHQPSYYYLSDYLFICLINYFEIISHTHHTVMSVCGVIICCTLADVGMFLMLFWGLKLKLPLRKVEFWCLQNEFISKEYNNLLLISFTLYSYVDNVKHNLYIIVVIIYMIKVKLSCSSNNTVLDVSRDELYYI